MQATRLAIPDVVLLRPKRHGDARGYFVESFNARSFEAATGLSPVFVQDNEALSVEVGTVRGLHFQRHPTAQGKLVRAIKGAIFDVAVDIRTGSPTFGRHVSATLTAEAGEQLWVPPGFAHGYCTTLPDSVIAYKVTDFYSAADDGGIAWDDPALGIEWPLASGAALLSDKDRRQPKLADLPATFTYEA
ncbi:dTDP-4-dehydrorhamnose 3,5-epimerase [Lichenibacterium dinghuense]|uniref:dTDP-4-dehydrorhamnose 3,5-epimerase n=1 Tax=Lichenibacterium dinghuense TaxID=2895977 RepID=UPI001F020832|nr:dTDP-4-dehydrorhamnose 3,5-epimerase [Lichenibacterium sp. 6Y81]